MDPPTLLMAALLGVLAGLWAAHFHGWGRMDLPVSHVRGSDWDVQLTLLEAAARQWLQGETPLWNPWTAGGVPLWANPEAPVFHPITWAAMVWHPATVARAVLVSHIGLQVAGTALLARVLGARWAALPVVAIALLTTDVLVWRMAHGHLMMAQAAWIPWAMAAALGVRAPVRAGAVTAIIVAIAVHGGGHYPAWIAMASTGLLVLAVRLTSSARSIGARASDAVLRLGTLAILTGLLAAPRWLPTAKALAETPRLRGPQAPLAMGDYSLTDAIFQVFAPALTSLPEAVGLHEGLPGWGTPVIGLFAVVALVFTRPRRRAPLVGAALAVLLFAVISIGHNFPGNAYALLHAVPPLDRFRNPERWAMAWVPLLSAMAAVGCGACVRRLARTHRAAGLAAFAVIAAALVIHTSLALPTTRAHTTIDQVTPDTYRRAAPTLPSAVRDPLRTNFEGTADNEVCLSCSDALLHEAPPQLAEGLWTPSGRAELRSWSPSRIELFVPVDPSASPKEPMDTEVVLPQAFRVGWTAKDETGHALQIGPDPAGTRVRVPTPGRTVVVEYVPPGWSLARSFGLMGLLLSVFALWHRPRPSPAKEARSPRPKLRSTPGTANPSG